MEKTVAAKEVEGIADSAAQCAKIAMENGRNRREAVAVLASALNAVIMPGYVVSIKIETAY